MQETLDLVLDAQKGDLDAFGGLVEAFQDMAYAAAVAWLGDFHLAQDAAQEAFIEAYRDLGQLREPEAFPAWLRQIVFKRCDRLRRRRGLSGLPIEAAAGQAGTEMDPASMVEHAELKAQVMAALRSLPEDQRVVTALYYINGYSTNEIAGFMDVPVTTVKKRLHDSREKLKERMLGMVKEKLHKEAPSRDDNLSNAVQMINACKSGNAAKVRELLKADPKLVECEAENGRFAPLHYATREGHAEVVKILLKAGADPHPWEHMLRHHLGITTLDIARARGFKAVVELIEEAIQKKHKLAPGDSEIRDALKKRDLKRIAACVKKKPACAKAGDDDGNTPLHRAAESEFTQEARDLVDELVKHGADMYATNHLGFKPVDLTLFRNNPWASKRPRFSLTGYFLAKGAECNINIAAALGDIGRVRSLLDEVPKRANFQDTCKKRPLSCAAEFGHSEIVKLLLERGADPNAQETAEYKCFPLWTAVDQNNFEMAKVLLEKGADPDAYVDSAGNALYKAWSKGWKDLADLLASYGASMSPMDFAWNCDLPVLSSMLKLKPEIAGQLLESNDEGKPEKSKMVVRLAFKFGADPKKVGQWTLFRASEAPELLKTFLEGGVNPNASDKEGKTILHAIQRMHQPKVRAPHIVSAGLLLDYGADINAKDDVYQATPLTWAVIFGNQEMVEFLLSRGAKTNLPDDEPWATPLFWAEYKGLKEIAQILRKHGAKA